MKVLALIVISALALVLNAQTPKPLPAFNASALNGNWYLSMEYSPDINNQNVSAIACPTLSINAQGGSVTWNQSYEFVNFYSDGVFTLTNVNGSTWVFDNSYYAYIVGYDYKFQSWFIMTDSDGKAYLYTNSQSAPQSWLTTIAYGLLKAESYPINSTNYYTYNNAACEL